MKTKPYLFIILAILTQNIFFLQAQNTQGKLFWLTFGKNASFTSSNETDFKIRIASGGKYTTGTLYFTHLGTTHQFEVQPQQVYTYTLTAAQRQAVYNTTMGITNFSIRIETSNPVTAYAMNIGGPYIEATNILPVATLGTNYRQISYTPTLYFTTQFLDAYAVIATEDTTTVKHNGGSPQVLNKGQVYYRTSATDMTGDLITSNKPVAFFALNQCAQIPKNVEYGDPLIQQLAPVETWGTKFFVPVSNQGKNITRIVASQNGTNISAPGSVLLSPIGGQSSLNNLQAGQFVELEVSVINKGCYITSNKPVGVCTYLPSNNYPTPPFGDPAQCWLPAVEQSTPTALIAPFLVSYITWHYALVSTPTATKKNTKVSIGGAPSDTLTGGNWVDNSNGGISFYAMPLTNASASYLFDNPAGIIVLCYGLGGASSYYYLAGSAMRNLTAAFFVNDYHYLELPESFSCTNKVEFRAEIVGLDTSQAGALKWFINGEEETDARDHILWEKTFSKGEYEIEMQVRFVNYETASYKCIINVEGLWIKIKNVKY